MNAVSGVSEINHAIVTYGSESVSYFDGDTERTPFPVPTKTDCTFAGFYYDEDVRVIDENGGLIANVEGYTDAEGKWDRSDDAPLELTAIFIPGVIAP